MEIQSSTTFRPEPIKWYSIVVIGGLASIWIGLCVVSLTHGATWQKICGGLGLGFTVYLVYHGFTTPRINSIDLRDWLLTVTYGNGQTATFNLRSDVQQIILGQDGVNIILKSGENDFGLNPNRYKDGDRLKTLLDQALPAERVNSGGQPEPARLSEIEKIRFSTRIDPKNAFAALAIFVFSMFGGPWIVTQFMPGAPKLWMLGPILIGLPISGYLILRASRIGKVEALSSEAARKQDRNNAIALVLLFALSGGFLLRNGWKIQTLLKKGQTTEATVIREYECSSRRNPNHSCIDYDFEANLPSGERQKFKGTAHTWHKELGHNPAGSKVTIRYSPNQPSLFDIPDTQDSARAYSSYGMGILLLFLAMGFSRSVLRVSRRTN